MNLMNRPNMAVFKLILAAYLALFPRLSHAQAPYAVWNTTYNGTGNFRDEAAAVAVDADGNAIVTGTSDGAAGLPEITTLKYSAIDGTVLWQRRRPAPSGITETSRFIATDSSGSVIVVGAGRSQNLSYTYAAKYRGTDGALLWERIDPIHLNSFIDNGIAVDSKDNVILIGGDKGVWRIVKYAAADGASIWDRQYKISEVDEGGPNSVAVDAGGNVIVCGSMLTAGVDLNSYSYTAKYSATDGAVLWERRYNSLGMRYNTAGVLAVDAFGNAIVSGISAGPSAGTPYRIKYAAADGALLWETRDDQWSYLFNRHPVAISLDASGNVFIASDTDSLAGPNTSSCSTSKYDATTGSLIWEKRYNAPDGYYDNPTSLAVDKAGNVFTAGYSRGLGGYDDFFVVHYQASDGVLLSEFRQANRNPSQYVTPVIALDSSGHVIVTGTTPGKNNLAYDYITFKVAMQGTPETTIPQPPTVVQQPRPINLAVGSAKRVFGRVKVGRSGAARIFTIRNNGTSFIRGIRVSLTGRHARDFVITKTKKTTLAPGGALIFKVSFRPKTKGSRAATLQIVSNDPNGNPSGIQLSGIGLR